MTGLNIQAKSSIFLSLRKCRCHAFIFSRIFLAALVLTAGVKLMKCFPHRFFDLRGLNVKPRKSNFSSGNTPLLTGHPVSLQPGTSPQALQTPPRGGRPALRQFAGPRGITPEFGYEPPSLRLSGTLTHLMTCCHARTTQ